MGLVVYYRPTYLKAADPTVDHLVDAQFEHVALAQGPRAEHDGVVELGVDSRARRGQSRATEPRVATMHAMETHLTAESHHTHIIIVCF